GPWEHLGRSPIEARGPLGYYRWRATKPGFAPFEGSEAGASLLNELRFVLDAEGTRPAEMVRVPGGNVTLENGSSIRLDDFFIDRFEVTNREFKAFVDAGGYRKPEYWHEPFVKDGRALSWEE